MRNVTLPTRINVSLSAPLEAWLREESRRLGLSMGEVIRRILDQAREASQSHPTAHACTPEKRGVS